MDAWHLVFIGFGLTGAALLLASLIFGELGELIGDTDVSTDTDGPSWFSTSVIGTALVAYGAVGLLATSYTDNGLVAVAVGIVAAVAMAHLVRTYILAPLMRNQHNVQISQNSYAGKNATVTITVPPRGLGEVQLVDNNGTLVHVPARCNSYEPFHIGMQVVITSMNAGTAIIDVPSNAEGEAHA